MASRVRIGLLSFPLFLLSMFSGLGCAANEIDDTFVSGDNLRTDPSAMGPTHDPTVRLLGGYNAFLDRGTTTSCVKDRVRVDVGDLESELYLKHVSSKEELAKELDVDIGASLKLPKGSVDASTKTVTTLKSSAMTATFIMRASRSYTVTPKENLEMTEQARGLLARGAERFLTTCGGSFAKSVRYQAEVIAIIQMDARTEEDARNIQTAVSGTVSGLPKVANATADVKTKYQEIADKYHAKVDVTVRATGFVTRDGSSVENVVEKTFEKFDELRADLNASFDADLAHDRAGYWDNGQRNARASKVAQATYAQLPNAPSTTAFAQNTTKLGNAEEFFASVAGLEVRLETVFTDEVDRYLSDRQRWGGDQFRYNVLPSPKTLTPSVTANAERYADLFRPANLPKPEGTLVRPLRMTIERCLAGAANGDYTGCASDAAVEKAKSDALAGLADYTAHGRVVPLVAWMPTLGETVSYYRAEGRCRDIEMRLPKRSEMRLIAPTVLALATPTGEVWFAEDNVCQKPVYKNGHGEGVEDCETGLFENLPGVGDRPVICVGLNGPVPALPRP